jgi:pyrroline-5-carboxylate reductase
MNASRIVFIGGGNIAEAIISGLIRCDRKIRGRITVTDIRPERLTYLSHKFAVRTTDNNLKAARDNDVIVLSVKPQQAGGVLSELSGKITPAQLVISVAACITTAYIEKFLGDVPVIRTMPNTPVLAGRGMTVFCRGAHAAKRHEKTVHNLFGCVGIVMALPEKYFDAVTAVSGSGPAYVFYLAEAMVSAAEKMGIEGKSARLMVKQTVAGAGELLSSSEDDPAALRYRVTSPGGTTESAIKHFEEKKLRRIIIEALSKARARSRELTK